MNRFALLLALSACATGVNTSTSTHPLRSSGGDRAGDLAGPICDPSISCGGTADPVEIGIGVAVLVGIVLARYWQP